MTPNLTAGGKNLLLRALTGETINFTKVQLGNGLQQKAEEAIGLSNPLITVPLSSISVGNNYVTLTAIFSNSAVTSGFRITEAGFFAEDPDDPTKEILYALGNEKESSADYVPENSNRILEMQFDALIFIGDAENVTAVVNSSLVYASKSEFDDHTENTQNPHGVTKAQVGLENVPNVATNDQTPTYTDTTVLATLSSGEKLSTAFSKIKLAITRIINHLSDGSNPHGVSASQVGAAAELHTHSTADIISGTLSPARGGTGVTSLDALAKSLVDNGLTRIVTGMYAGNGDYGINKQKKLTFTSPPKLILVMPQTANALNTANSGFIALRGVTSLLISGVSSGDYEMQSIASAVNSVLHLTWEGNTVSWYGISAAQQCNASNNTYCYIALL
ncbi:MAG: hypothetical protein J1F23_08465 [Oscillospiraceae bacterium]|nr:hypothetical protein [Oscillospiraceae bacterium]